MTRFNFKKIIGVAACVLASILFILSFFFLTPQIKDAAPAEGVITESASGENGTLELEKDFTALRISGLSDLQYITKVNYVADEFVAPDTIPDNCEIVDLNESFEFAEKGSIIFVILNLDPYAEDFAENLAKLNKYKTGDYWQFSLYLPKIFSASNVYQKSALVTRNGEIAGYEFIDYNTSYDAVTEEFSPCTDNAVINLQFYTRRQVMENTLGSAQIITVHYQSAGTAYSGIADFPLIGERDAVKYTVTDSQNLLISFAVIAMVALAVFTVLSVLKKTYKFIPAVFIIAGIILTLFSSFILGQETTVPLLWCALRNSSVFLPLVGAIAVMKPKVFEKLVLIANAALCFAGWLLAFISPFVSFSVCQALNTVCLVLKLTGAAAVTGLILLNLLQESNGKNALTVVCMALIAVTLVSASFLPKVMPCYLNAQFWLYVAIIAVAFADVFIIMRKTEKENEYLTANLHLAVERQVKDIKAVIDERDDILRFVSHDMKKPLSSSVALLSTVAEREKDAEQIKVLQIIRQNTERVITNLSEISGYAKFNYVAEPPQEVDLKELCESVCGFHRPDCTANGIILTNLAVNAGKVFAKRQGLENAVSNIILNAVEHSACSEITLAVKEAKNKIILCIADDGKGIDAGIDVFRPYVSENKPETGGIGLFICKNIIESMDGGLTYRSEAGRTEFYISLLKA